MTRIRQTLPPLVAALLSAGTACSPAPPAPAPSTPEPRADTGYLFPPELAAAVRLGGRLTFSGSAPANAQVRLVSPDGSMASAMADGQGRWSLAVPAPAETPAMYALSAMVGDRVVRAEGAVLALPPSGPPAVLARAGTGVAPLDGPSKRLRVTALDYDEGGGAAVAGTSPPGARVRLSIDGAPDGFDQADTAGRFAVVGANRPLTPGSRRLLVEMDGAPPAERVVAVSPAAPLGRAAFRAVRQDGAWRVDWARPGGGVQTTVVFDTPALDRAGPAS
jgi:hypothetical protein